MTSRYADNPLKIMTLLLLPLVTILEQHSLEKNIMQMMNIILNCLIATF